MTVAMSQVIALALWP